MSTADPRQIVRALYCDHHGWLHNWLRSKLGCSEQAADVAHDTFLRVLDREQQRIESPRAYLRTIAGGLLVDHFRRRSLERAYLETLALLPEPETVTLEEREIILEALHHIDAMLDRLPSVVRKVFLLSQLDGFTYEQIAQQLGISVRTVKRYMQQGFARCLSALL